MSKRTVFPGRCPGLNCCAPSGQKTSSCFSTTVQLLTLALLLTAFGAPRVRAADVDPYLPADSDFVLVVQTRELAEAALVKPQLPALRTALKNSAPGELLTALALDPLADLDSLLLTGTAAALDKRWLAVARGRFDLRKLQAGIDARLQKAPDSLQIEKTGRFTVYQFKQPAAATLLACFLDETTLVLTPSREQLAGCLATKEGTRQGAVAKELKAVIEQQKAQTLWLAGLASLELKQALGTSAETRKIFDNLEHFRGGLSVGAGLEGEFLIQTKNGPTASEVRKFLEGVKAILSLAALDRQQEGQRLTDLVAAIGLLSVKETVTLRISLSKEQIEKALPGGKR